MPLAERFDFLKRAENAQRWAHILHAMMLRKYFSPADELSLVKVIEAVEECLTTRPPEFDAWKAQRLADIEYQRKFGSPWRVIALDGSEVGLGSVLLDDLYGGLLHGDWDKAQRRHTGPVLGDHTVWDWCSASAGMVRLILAEIVDGVARGEVARV